MMLPNRDPEQVDAAWKFVEWLLEPDHHVRHIVGGGGLPSRKSLIGTDSWQTHIERQPYLIDAVNGVLAHGYSYEPDPRAQTVRTALVEETRAFTNGAITIEQWIENIVTAARAAY